ncbi:hypothetical protein V1358_10345 [Pseudoalteromonas sp. YIC-656]|uniref:hypothetical protein n=1 Tax=Pseudoalteromonas pernae TaxID=3118054 RepID=UPI003242A54D
MRHSSSRVLIIGNAPIEKELAEQVDSFDRVVRFNHCAGLPKHLGTKCTDLWLTGRGKQAQRLANQAAVIAPCLLEHVMITDPVPNRFSQGFYKAIRRQSNLDYGASLLVKYAQAQSKSRISRCSRENLLIYLLGLGKPEHTPRWPSSGALAINHFVSMGYHVHIVGFGFEGWKRHPWELEKLYVEQLSLQGHLSYL